MAKPLPKKYRGNIQNASVTTNDTGIRMSVTLQTDNYISWTRSRRDEWIGEGYHKRLGEIMLEKYYDQFERGVDFNDIPWKPLAPSTIARKLRLGYSDKILVETGGTRDSLRAVESATQVEITIGGYSQYHQETRPILVVGSQDEPRILKLSEDYVRTKEKL